MANSVGATSEAGQVRPSSSQFRTHEFGFDPFERVSLSLRDPVRRRRLSLVSAGAVAAVLATGSWFAFASVERSPIDGPAVADRERKVAELDVEIERRARQVAELETRRSALESEIAGSSTRLSAIEDKHAAALRELAELTAPVAPSADERVAARSEPEQAIDAVAPEAAAVVSAAASSEEAENVAPRAAAPEASAAPAVGEKASAAQVRVFIHVRSSDRAARERAAAVAEELRRRGVLVAEIRGVVRPVRRDAVRFFYDADRTAVTTLQDAVRSASAPGDAQPQSQDFRSYGAPPRPGTLELWLS